MARRLAALPLLLGFTVLLVSCDPARPPATDTDPVPGGELVVAVRDLGTLDPAKASGRGALLAVSQIFDSLTAIDSTTGQVVPAAASSWKVSEDGLRWTFNLRRGATFHDGTGVRSRDFERAFDRISRKAVGSDAAFQLEHVKGFRESHTLGEADELAGITTNGPRVLKIELTRPFAELPHSLAHPALAPLARAYQDRLRRLADRPIGNGPFKVASAILEEAATLERNDQYTPSPFLDSVQLLVASNIDDGWRLFRRDEVDITDVPVAEIDAARSRYGLEGFTPQWSTLSFGPNLDLRKYRTREVRVALSLAIDREAIATTVYGNTKDPATGILPRGLRGYLPDACSVCEHDLARARGIIEAAFGDDPPTIAIDHLNDQASRLVSRTIGTQLEDAGLEVVLRAHAPAAYLKVLQDGKHDLAQLGWLSDVPSPDGFLAQQLRTGSPNNQTGWTDQDFDGLIDRARRQSSEDTRLALYRRAEERALSQMPMIPIVFFRNRTAIADRVRGLEIDGAGLFDASTVWLAT